MYLKTHEPASSAARAMNMLIQYRNMRHDLCLAIAELDITLRAMNVELGLPPLATAGGCPCAPSEPR